MVPTTIPKVAKTTIPMPETGFRLSLNHAMAYPKANKTAPPRVAPKIIL
jgi:hypothetical protein